MPQGEVVQIRLKGQPPLREAVAWYCLACGELVHAHEFVDAIPQRQYWRAVHEFNADDASARAALAARFTLKR